MWARDSRKVALFRGNGILPPMRIVLALFVALSVWGCARGGDAIPTDREIAAMAPDDLERRFAAVDARIRRAGLDDAAVAERAAAGHSALVAFERTHDARFSPRARRWLGVAAIDGREDGPACRAAFDLARLDHSLGDDAAAIVRIRDTLASAVGDVPCRDALRAFATPLGVATTPTTVAGGDASANITNVEVLGALDAGTAGVRVMVSLDADARGELYPVVDVRGRRVARLRFAKVTRGAGVRPRDVHRGGLERIETPANSSGLDLLLEAGATVRVSVLTSPVRWILDVDRAPVRRTRGESAVIVLDPGHGGDEHGARVDGVRESTLVLDIARRAASTLAALAPGSRIVLTRTTDDEVSLEQRAALANSLDADVFVSIHLNDADVQVLTGGITTFVLDTDDGRQARRLAARENGTTTDRVSGLSVLLAGIERESQATDSRRLAGFVHASALGRARQTLPRLPDRGVRPATYYVLVGTRMPAVLVECSFMTRPEELAALRSAPYRQALADGIARGIAQYLGTR